MSIAWFLLVQSSMNTNITIVTIYFIVQGISSRLLMEMMGPREQQKVYMIHILIITFQAKFCSGEIFEKLAWI